MKSQSPRLYKGRYLIVFYDKTDTDFLYMFDNVREILEFQGKPYTRLNRNLINVELCRALLSKDHFVRFLNGTVMRVYIVDFTENEENENERFRTDSEF